MYCPNCGEEQESERPSSCPDCGLPLGGVAEILNSNKAAIEQKERQTRETRDRLIGSAVFVGLAAVSIGLGVKNSLQSGTQLQQPPGKATPAR